MANQPMVPGMMPGFNLPAGPGPQFSPELLAQLAAAGFHPPGLMGGGGGMQGAQTPGFNIGDGMAGLSAGLSAYGKANKGQPFMAAERTAGDRDMNGYGASPVDPMSGNPNAQPVEVFNPTGAVGGGGGSSDPFAWIRRMLGQSDPLTGSK